MTQIILTEVAGSWSYVILRDGKPIAGDTGYDDAASALSDATTCPTLTGE